MKMPTDDRHAYRAAVMSEALDQILRDVERITTVIDRRTTRTELEDALGRVRLMARLRSDFVRQMLELQEEM